MRSVLLAATLAALVLPVAARADISITFDDGYASNYTIARPILLANHIPATFYIISGWLNQGWTMTTPEVKQLSDDGFEIGSHTLTHPHLPTLTLAAATLEITQSRIALEHITGRPVTSFAYPYGETNPILDAICFTTYTDCRRFGPGTPNPFASIDTLDTYGYGVDADTSLDQVKTWINQGRDPNTLVILVYHNLEQYPSNPYASKPRRFARAMRYLARSGIPVITMQQAASR